MFSTDRLIILPANSTPQEGHVVTSSHHGTNWHIENDQVSQKNHQDWSIGAEIVPIFISVENIAFSKS